MYRWFTDNIRYILKKYMKSSQVDVRHKVINLFSLKHIIRSHSFDCCLNVIRTSDQLIHPTFCKTNLKSWQFCVWISVWGDLFFLFCVFSKSIRWFDLIIGKMSSCRYSGILVSADTVTIFYRWWNYIYSRVSKSWF